MILYHNAFNEAGDIVEIKNITHVNRSSMQFFCIGCEGEMEAVLGKVKQHHFRHKSIGNCNPETYLHRLAKRIIKHKFDTQPDFYVKYYAQNECTKYAQCELREEYSWYDCSSVALKAINLKEYYDTCEEEKNYKGFRADLLLTHSQYPDRKPVFLEVVVSNECSPEKINSKIRIIEIKIHNETDAFRQIVENEGEFIPEINNLDTANTLIPPIRFFNFKRKNKVTHEMSRFYLYKSKEGVLQAECNFNVVSCQDAGNVSEKEGACFTVTVSKEKIPNNQYGQLYALGIFLAHKKGFKINSCYLCSHFNLCTTQKGVQFNTLNEFFVFKDKFMGKQLSFEQIEYQLAYNCPKYKPNIYSRDKYIRSFNIPYKEWILKE